MEIGYVKFIKPKHPKLKDLIKGYYVHSSSDKNFYSKLSFFQNITSTISIYRHSRTESSGRFRKQYFDTSNPYNVLLVGLVDKYQEVEFFGPLDRVAIVFYPLGINHFIKTDLCNLLEKHYSYFDYFDPDFTAFLDEVYQVNAIEGKRDLLDAFFLENYQGFEDAKLIRAVNILKNSTSLPKVSELAASLNLSRRTLLRKFKKHTGYAIEKYISVIKFRKALLHFQKNKDNLEFTQIALDSNYYDQADFNHQIKNRSELTPKQLIERLNLIDNTLFWKL